jgi:hypothetical protein
VDYSFPLPGDDGNGKTTPDRWQIGERAKLADRRAETFVGPSSPGPTKKQVLCVLRDSVVNIFLKLYRPCLINLASLVRKTRIH